MDLVLPAWIKQIVSWVDSSRPKRPKLQRHLARLWHPYFEVRMVYCSSTILRAVKLSTEIKKKRTQMQKNNYSMETMGKLKDLPIELLRHPAHSPDLGPSEYSLFVDLKKRYRKIRVALDWIYHSWRRVSSWIKLNFVWKLLF